MPQTVDETLSQHTDDEPHTQKDVAYYLQHPDALPTDESELNALMATLSHDDDETASSPTPTSTPDDTDTTAQADASDKDAKENDAQREEDTSASTEDDDGELVAADGKTPIPYSVLKGTRQQLQQTQASLEAERQKVVALQQQLSTSPSPPAKTDQTSSTQEDEVDLSKIDFDQLRQDYADEIVNPLEQAVKQVARLSEQVNTLSGKEATRAVSEEERIANEVQSAIDAIPVLSHWQSNDERLWQRAVALDAQLKNEAEFADVSYQARFEAVAKLLNGGQLAVTTPPSSASDANASHAKPGAKLKDVNQALEDASISVPTSLSDIPGGQAPAQSDFEQLQGLSEVQLAEQMQSWSKDKIDQYLAAQGV